MITFLHLPSGSPRAVCADRGVSTFPGQPRVLPGLPPY